MDPKKILTLLLVAASVPLASAGATTITDPPGDAPAHLDVTSVTVTNTASAILVDIKVSSFSEPLLASDFRALYRTTFSFSGADEPVNVDAEVHGASVPDGVSTSVAGVRPGVGVYVSGSEGFRGKATVDTLNGVISVQINRAYFPSGSFGPGQFVASGTLLSGLSVSTAAGDSVLIAMSPMATTVFGAPWTPADATSATAYAVQ